MINNNYCYDNDFHCDFISIDQIMKNTSFFDRDKSPKTCQYNKQKYEQIARGFTVFVKLLNFDEYEGHFRSPKIGRQSSMCMIMEDNFRRSNLKS